jgi:hypothetical protein
MKHSWYMPGNPGGFLMEFTRNVIIGSSGGILQNSWWNPGIPYGFHQDSLQVLSDGMNNWLRVIPGKFLVNSSWIPGIPHRFHLDRW